MSVKGTHTEHNRLETIADKTQVYSMDTPITVCCCSSRKIMNRTEVIKLVSALKNAGYPVAVVPDLCKIAVSDSGQMAAIAETTVVACYPRAVRSMFDGWRLQPKQFFDIRNHSSEQVLEDMGIISPEFLPEQSLPELAPEQSLPQFTPDTGNDVWNPVIDKERCTACGKCHDFCLFGVYAAKEGTVVVAQPQNCKNNCPACARVCPSKAIIFPKYEKSPVNGGLHDEEICDGTGDKLLYNIALKYKLEERRKKVLLFKKSN